MEAKKIYKDYPVKVQEYMQYVIDCLKQEHKDIPSSWRVSLDLIADNYNIYLQAKEDVQKNGLLRKDKHGRTFKNQCFPLMCTMESNLIKLLSSFALTPMSRSRMRTIDTDEFDFDSLLDAE